MLLFIHVVIMYVKYSIPPAGGVGIFNAFVSYSECYVLTFIHACAIGVRSSITKIEFYGKLRDCFP